MITNNFGISPTLGEHVDGILFDCTGSIAVDDDNTGGDVTSSVLSLQKKLIS